MHIRVRQLGIIVRKVTAGHVKVWRVRPPQKITVPVVLFVFGDATLKNCRWGAAKVLDSQGAVWLEFGISVKAFGLNTKLAEGSGVVFAVFEVADYVSLHGISISELLVLSSCFSSVQCLQSWDLREKTASIMDMVIAHCVMAHLSAHMAWVPAQHDTALDY